MKRTPLKRGKPLKRSGPLARGHCALKAKKPMRRKRKGAPRRGRAIDLPHKAFVESLPCCAPGCRLPAPSIAHHATTKHGKGQQADDRRAMPLCWPHHEDFHKNRGPFLDWKKEQRAEWQEEQIAAVLAIAPANSDTHVA
jgi:hypothetical protein